VAISVVTQKKDGVVYENDAIKIILKSIPFENPKFKVKFDDYECENPTISQLENTAYEIQLGCQNLYI
jgi:hypothetical protein